MIKYNNKCGSCGRNLNSYADEPFQEQSEEDKGQIKSIIIKNDWYELDGTIYRYKKLAIETYKILPKCPNPLCLKRTFSIETTIVLDNNTEKASGSKLTNTQLFFNENLEAYFSSSLKKIWNNIFDHDLFQKITTTLLSLRDNFIPIELGELIGKFIILITTKIIRENRTPKLKGRTMQIIDSY